MNVAAISKSEDNCLTKFLDIEEVPSHSSHLTSTEQAVQQHYGDNTSYVAEQNRYRVLLPRKTPEPVLGESRGQALQKFHSNEKSILRKGTWGRFEEVVQQYIDLGHVQLVSEDEMATPPQETFYMPMHGVTKEASSSTKLRVVFDGSAHTSSHASLNDIMEVGPTLHPPLHDILIRFRTFRVALSADISKMYRDILLHPRDHQLHKFLWRPHPEGVV